MTNNQKSFLTELAVLLKKYNIDMIWSNTPIEFIDQQEITLTIHSYEDGAFNDIHNVTGYFKPAIE